MDKDEETSDALALTAAAMSVGLENGSYSPAWGPGTGHAGINAGAGVRGGDTDEDEDEETMTQEGARKRRNKQAWMPPPDAQVKVALSLYKVQQNIYLLDFQRVEGDAFGFMKLCAFIITELKNLSAASRAAAPSAQAVQALQALAPQAQGHARAVQAAQASQAQAQANARGYAGAPSQAPMLQQPLPPAQFQQPRS
ncbi:hypothetical protein B484DRAFT_247885 [Ochromonadaceae sp. CCMP2298]|nr:hypothetical protein B484DRAFT_247885 [Ochromonadaceae sp. CCMP2298]